MSSSLQRHVADIDATISTRQEELAIAVEHRNNLLKSLGGESSEDIRRHPEYVIARRRVLDIEQEIKELASEVSDSDREQVQHELNQEHAAAVAAVKLSGELAERRAAIARRLDVIMADFVEAVTELEQVNGEARAALVPIRSYNAPSVGVLESRAHLLYYAADNLSEPLAYVLCSELVRRMAGSNLRIDSTYERSVPKYFERTARAQSKYLMDRLKEITNV